MKVAIIIIIKKTLHTTLPRVVLHYLYVFTVTFDENGMVLKLNRLINLA